MILKQCLLTISGQIFAYSLYKNVGSVAIRTLLSFSSTYLRESGFSALVSMKTKFRNKLECEADLRCALSSTKPRIKRLVSQKQLHPSH